MKNNFKNLNPFLVKNSYIVCRRFLLGKDFLGKRWCNLNDKELIKRIQSGEKELLGILIDRYYYDIYRFCYYKTGNSNLSYDLTQDTFFRFIKYISSYTYKNLKSYLFTIAVNVCNDYFKNQKLVYTSVEDIDEAEFAFNKTSNFEIAYEVQAALSKLPDFQKDAVILRYYQDLKISEIAKILGVGIPTVKSRIYQGLNKLKKILEKEDFN